MSEEGDLAQVGADLALGRRRVAARRLLGMLPHVIRLTEVARLLSSLIEPPANAVLAERLRFGPPETWRGWHPDHGLVVVKLWPDNQQGDAGLLERRQGFRHAGVATLLSWGQGWTVSAWISGTPLSARPPLDPARILAAIGATVAALHGAGLAHGDITPANVVVTPEGDPVLIDWGEPCCGTPGWCPDHPADPVTRDLCALDRMRDWLGQTWSDDGQFSRMAATSSGTL